MKRRIVKIVIASTVAILGFLNFSANTKSDSKDVNLVQEAQASIICAEYYGGEQICCKTVSGSCSTGWGDYEFY